MFTGIVEEVGEIAEVIDTGEFRSIRVRADRILEDVADGASILTSGVCITASAVGECDFTAELSRETLHRTTFSAARPGQHVNLERSMRAQDRFGGHIVQGHVDGVGRIRRFDRKGDDWILEVEYDPDDESRLVWKGSVAVEGISLTVADLTPKTLSIAIIPFTLENTNLKYAKPGDAVNLEFDVLAKYVEKLVQPYIERLQKGV